LSSIAYSDLNSTRQILKDYGPRRVILALDYGVGGEVRTGGWKTNNSEHIQDALSRFLSEGFTTFLLTSVVKDGMLQGPDLTTLSNIRNKYHSKKSKAPRLIASGGISSLKDLEALQKLGIEEAIVGKAIYEGKIDLRFILSKFRDN
jgi:phosphoribosylformimino-5-aminoimidazole carboxamide ribotide isomerase